MKNYAKKFYLFGYKEIKALVVFYFLGNPKAPKRHLTTFLKIVLFPIFLLFLSMLLMVCALYSAIALIIFVFDYSIYVSIFFYPFIIPKFLVEIIRYFLMFLGYLFFFSMVSLLRMMYPEKGDKQGVDEGMDGYNIEGNNRIL